MNLFQEHIREIVKAMFNIAKNKLSSIRFSNFEFMSMSSIFVGYNQVILNNFTRQFK